MLFRITLRKRLLQKVTLVLDMVIFSRNNTVTIKPKNEAHVHILFLVGLNWEVSVFGVNSKQDKIQILKNDKFLTRVKLLW